MEKSKIGVMNGNGSGEVMEPELIRGSAGLKRKEWFIHHNCSYFLSFLLLSSLLNTTVHFKSAGKMVKKVRKNTEVEMVMKEEEWDYLKPLQLHK